MKLHSVTPRIKLLQWTAFGGLALLLGIGFAQDLPPAQAPLPSTTATSPVQTTWGQSPVGTSTVYRPVVVESRRGSLPGMSREETKKLSEIMDNLREGQMSASEQDDARGEIIELLSKPFDEDISQREKQIEQLEERLEKLKAQVDKRKDAKNRILELQVELLMNDAEGLGFPNGWNSMLSPQYGYRSVPSFATSAPAFERFSAPQQLATPYAPSAPAAVVPRFPEPNRTESLPRLNSQDNRSPRTGATMTAPRGQRGSSRRDDPRR